MGYIGVDWLYTCLSNLLIVCCHSFLFVVIFPFVLLLHFSFFYKNHSLIFINVPSIKLIFIYPILHFVSVIYCCLLISSLLCPICLFYVYNIALYFLSLFTFLGMVFSLDILFSIFSHGNTWNNAFFCFLLKWRLSRVWGYTNKVVYSVQSSWPLTKQPQWRNDVYWLTIAELIRAPRAVCLTLWHSASMSVCVSLCKQQHLCLYD